MGVDQDAPVDRVELDRLLARLASPRRLVWFTSPGFLSTIQRVCERVRARPARLGLLVGAAGLDPSIAANKVRGVRAARCVSAGDAREARARFGVNVLCLDAATPIARVATTVRGFLELGEAPPRLEARRGG